MSHHTEAFLADEGGWGWQCFEPGCGKEVTGLADCYTAEAMADRHEREMPGGVHAANIARELARLEREDPAVRAASKRLDAVNDYLQGRLPPPVVEAIYDLARDVREATKATKADFTLSPPDECDGMDSPEPRYLETLDADERGGR